MRPMQPANHVTTQWKLQAISANYSGSYERAVHARTAREARAMLQGRPLDHSTSGQLCESENNVAREARAKRGEKKQQCLKMVLERRRKGKVWYYRLPDPIQGEEGWLRRHEITYYVRSTAAAN